MIAQPAPEAIDRALGRAATVAYTLLVLAALCSFWPGLRRRVLELLRWHLYLWELGQWERAWAQLPGYLREALEVRGRRRLRRQEEAPA